MEGVKSSPTLPAALRKRMADQGLSQLATAEILGTSGPNVNRWLGGAMPKPEFYEAICNFLDISLEALGGMIVRTELAKLQRDQL